MDTSLKKRKYYYHLDFIRLVLAIDVIHFHILNKSIMSHVNDFPIYKTLARIPAANNGAAVQIFFIFTGFFMYSSFRRNSNMSVFEYICDRVVRLWPVMFFALVMESVSRGSFEWQRFTVDSLFLGCSGLSLEYKSVLWFSSSMFFASIFLYAILKNYSRKKATVIISLVCYFALVFLVNYCGGRLGERETVLYVLNLGTVRAVAFVGWGILLSMISEQLAGQRSRVDSIPGMSRALYAVKFAIEALALVFFVKLLRGQIILRNELVYVIIFSAFLLCAVSDDEPMGKLFTSPKWAVLGSYGYSIYAMQQTGFNILKKTLWRNAALKPHAHIMLAASIAFCVVIGIATYYLVERPVNRSYSRWKKRRKAAQDVKV